MDVYIYFSAGLDVPIDVIEDALETRLLGRGEVTGSGSGMCGANLDIEIGPDQAVEDIVRDIRETLWELGAPPDTRVVVDGEKYSLTPPQ